MKLNVGAVFDRYAQAVYQKDVSQMMANYTDDVIVFDAFDTWVFRGKDAWRGQIIDWFEGLGNDLCRVTFSQVNTFADEANAAVSADVLYEPLGQVTIPSLHCRITFFLRKIDDDWKISHEHTSAPLTYEAGDMIQTRDEGRA